MKKHLLICTNQRLTGQAPSCGGYGAEALAQRLEQLIALQGADIELRRSECLGRCQAGPNLRIAPGGPFYQGVCDSDLPAILEDAIAFLPPVSKK
jgi:(2Fe-2S) ferredoxin